MSVRVTVDLSGVTRKLSKASMRKGRYAMANQMLADMNQFVPKDQGDLRQTGHVSADGDYLIWRTPYARAQFYGTNGIVAFKNYTTPGTGKRWDLVAKSRHINDWRRVFVEGSLL